MLDRNLMVHSLSPGHWARLAGLEADAAAGFMFPPRGNMLGTAWPPLPLDVLGKFIALMPAKPLVYVLAVFDEAKIWAGLLLHFENRVIREASGFSGLPEEDLKTLGGPENAELLLALVSNACQKPAFGWITPKDDFQAYMRSASAEEKAEIFQKGIIAKRAVFNCNALIKRGQLTADS